MYYFFGIGQQLQILFEMPAHVPVCTNQLVGAVKVSSQCSYAVLMYRVRVSLTHH